MNPDDLITSFPFTATSGLQATLADYKGKWLVLYFYPKDSTPGCTTEGQEFRDKYQDFKALNAEVFGISRDSLTSHENFKAKQQFSFDLISDNDEQICQQFDVIKMKSMYGKQVRGVERSTFIIDPTGKLRHAWRKVKVNGHVAEVFDTLLALQRVDNKT